MPFRMPLSRRHLRPVVRRLVVAVCCGFAFLGPAGTEALAVGASVYPSTYERFYMSADLGPNFADGSAYASLEITTSPAGVRRTDGCITVFYRWRGPAKADSGCAEVPNQPITNGLPMLESAQLRFRIRSWWRPGGWLEANLSFTGKDPAYVSQGTHLRATEQTVLGRRLPAGAYGDGSACITRLTSVTGTISGDRLRPRGIRARYGYLSRSLGASVAVYTGAYG